MRLSHALRLGVGPTAVVAVSAALVTTRPLDLGQAEVPGLETVYYDHLGPGGQLDGGVTRMPSVDDPAGVAVTPAPVTTLLSSAVPAGARALGSGSDNRVDLVFVGDGYTNAELGTYQNHVNNVVGGLFSSEPLGRYMDYFAVHRVDVVSNESGVDNDPNQGISRDTALDMGYWCNGIERLLCVNVGLAYSFANNAPNVDQVIALANSNKYGGAGYTSSNLATSSGGNGAAIEIVKHELGHSLGNLADEYTYGGPADWPGGEPTRQNVSTYEATEMANLGAKWAAWLGASAAGFDGTVGTFEGANYSVNGIYRPSNNSLMRALNRPFNLVGAQEVIKEIYREVEPIDGASDPGIAYGDADVLFVDPMQVSGAPLTVQWFLNGAPIPGANATTLDLATLGLDGCPAEVSVTVRDETPWIRDEAFRDSRMTQSLVFDVNTAWRQLACSASPNSVGPGADFFLAGSPSIADQDLTLGMSSGPIGAPVLFFYADTPVSQPLGEGVLCASGTSQRLAIAFVDALGTASVEVDFSGPPIASGATALSAGSTWIFQAWYRDTSPTGSAVFNFSSAIEATFCP